MEIVTLLGDLSPLGVIALLAYVVYLLISKDGPLMTIRDNHLHTIEGAMERLADNSDRQTELLADIKAGIEYLKGRAH